MRAGRQGAYVRRRHEHLAERDVAHEIVHLPQPSTTAALAAGAFGVPLGVIVKSPRPPLDGRPVPMFVSGDCSVDPGGLKAAGGCRRAIPASPGRVVAPRLASIAAQRQEGAHLESSEERR